MRRALAWLCLLSTLLVPPVAVAVDFAAPDLSGTQQRLSALRGRLTIVAVWATWCFPCRYELPLLEKLYRRHRDDGLQVVAVAADDEPEAVRRYVEEQGFSFPVLLDTHGRVKAVLGVASVPATFVLDRAGNALPFLDPATGASETKLDNPLMWKDPRTLSRIRELLVAVPDTP